MTNEWNDNYIFHLIIIILAAICSDWFFTKKFLYMIVKCLLGSHSYEKYLTVLKFLYEM